MKDESTIKPIDNNTDTAPSEVSSTDTSHIHPETHNRFRASIIVGILVSLIINAILVVAVIKFLPIAIEVFKSSSTPSSSQEIYQESKEKLPNKILARLQPKVPRITGVKDASCSLSGFTFNCQLALETNSDTPFSTDELRTTLLESWQAMQSEVPNVSSLNLNAVLANTDNVLVDLKPAAEDLFGSLESVDGSIYGDYGITLFKYDVQSLSLGDSN